MSYDEGMEFLVNAPYDSAEGDAEQSAHHQRSLDVLYNIGNEFCIPHKQMRELCEVACISFAELLKYQGAKS